MIISVLVPDQLVEHTAVRGISVEVLAEQLTQQRLMVSYHFSGPSERLLKR